MCCKWINGALPALKWNSVKQLMYLNLYIFRGKDTSRRFIVCQFYCGRVQLHSIFNSFIFRNYLRSKIKESWLERRNLKGAHTFNKLYFITDLRFRLFWPGNRVCVCVWGPALFFMPHVSVPSFIAREIEENVQLFFIHVDKKPS